MTAGTLKKRVHRFALAVLITAFAGTALTATQAAFNNGVNLHSEVTVADTLQRPGEHTTPTMDVLVCTTHLQCLLGLSADVSVVILPAQRKTARPAPELSYSSLAIAPDLPPPNVGIGI